MRYALSFLIFLFSMGTTQAQVDWGIGTKWTYTFVDNFDGKVVPGVIEIKDTQQWMGREVMVLESEILGDYRIFIEDNRVLFWVEEINDFVIGYDFGNDSTYTTPYLDWFGKAGEAVISIDSIGSEMVDGRRLAVQWYNYPDSTGSMRFGARQKVYEGIGYELNGMVPWLDGRIWAGSFWMDSIRCFENNGETFNFRNYPCDTSYSLITNTSDREPRHIELIPNPSNGNIQITNAEGCSYSVYDNLGRKIQSGILEGNEIFIGQQGLHIILINYKGSMISRQVVIH